MLPGPGLYLCTPPSMERSITLLSICLSPRVPKVVATSLAIISPFKVEEISHSDSHIYLFSKLLLLGRTAIPNCKEVWEKERGVRTSVVWGQPNHSVCHTLVESACGKSISNFLPWTGLAKLNNSVNFRPSEPLNQQSMAPLGELLHIFLAKL